MAITAPDVAPQPIPSVRIQPSASLETFGGGTGLEAEGQQVQKIAATTGDIATFEKIRADQTAVEEAQSKGSKLATDILYDPQTGVLGSKGTNALQAQKDGMTNLQKGLNEISQGLTSPQQIGAFNKWALMHADTINQTMMAHVDKELKAHDDASLESLVNNQAGLAALSHGNPQALALAFKTVNDNVDAYAQRNRLDKDGAAELKEKVNDKVHTAVIDGMLKFQSDDSAQKYFDANKDNISSAAQDKISVALEEGNIRNRSARQSVDIWKSTGGNLTDAFAQAEKIQNPEVQEMTKQRLRQLQSDKVAAQEADQNDKFQQAFKLVQKAALGGSAINLRDTIPPMLYTSLDASNQDKLKRFAFNTETNSQKWAEFSLMSPTQKAGLKPDELQDYMSYFDPRHRDQATKMYNDALGNKTNSISDSEQANLIYKSVQEAGIIPGVTPGKPVSKLRGAAADANGVFLSNSQQAIADYERTTLGGRRKASQEEVQKIIDQQILKTLGDKSPGVFTVAGRMMGLSVTPPTRYPEIPDDAKEIILTKARQMGTVVTKEQIENAYQAFQRKDRAGVEKALK